MNSLNSSPPPRRFCSRIATSFILACLAILSPRIQTEAAPPNLVPDPTFQKLSEAIGKPDQGGWQWHRIVDPCQARRHGQRGAALQGGRVFLHSTQFPVDNGTFYDFSVRVSGNAMLSAEILWWTRRGLPSARHRSVLIGPSQLQPESSRLTATIRSPGDAATAYVRLIGESGQAIVHEPSLVVAPGRLMLKLDAAAPGPKPQVEWLGLLEPRRRFRVVGAKHDVKQKSYVFATPGATCIGDVKDAPIFDFDTDFGIGPGRGQAFTVVLFARLTGRSGTGIINKMQASTGAGWAIGLESDEFGLDRITTLQQIDGRQRKINGSPGLALDGKNASLKARDGTFHLYVIHITGSGHHDGSVFFDGNDKPLTLRPWPFGALSQGSIRNDGPLAIGAFNERGFRGEIGFVEIWSGTRVLKGMTPGQYSRYRYRDGHPVRARQ